MKLKINFTFVSAPDGQCARTPCKDKFGEWVMVMGAVMIFIDGDKG